MTRRMLDRLARLATFIPDLVPAACLLAGAWLARGGRL